MSPLDATQISAGVGRVDAPPLAAPFATEVRGKGKHMAAESPGLGAGGASGSGGKWQKASADVGAVRQLWGRRAVRRRWGFMVLGWEGGRRQANGV